MEQRQHVGAAGVVDADSDPELTSQVEELLRALSTALRGYRLYGTGSPNLDRFVGALRDRFAEVWGELDRLRLDVEEHRFRWEGRTVFPLGGDTGDLPFLFYKDGIRTLTFLPGVEGEILELLETVARAPQLRGDEDDLVTLLWERDLTFLRYDAVELATESIETGAGAEPPARVDPAAVREAASSAHEHGFTPQDFQEAIYFLDEGELQRLAEEIRREAERDLWADVVAALFDRLEDGTPERRVRIVHVLGELLPSMLGAGRYDRAAAMIGELVELAGRPGLLPAPAIREVRTLFRHLSSRDTIDQLVQTLEDSPERVRGEDLSALLGYFPPESLAPLIGAVGAVARGDVRRLLEQAIERLATGHREHVVTLLGDPDPALVAEAARWVGRLQIGAAVGELVRILDSNTPAVRGAAIGAMQELRAATAARSILDRLEDDDRDVRIAAARALAILGYTPARGPLEAAVTGKRLRGADRTEKIAFFEAFGRLGGADAVPLLERMLNGRSWLGRGEPAEVRACAALGLARVRHPSAQAALAAAADDEDPVVRTAVARALRGEEA